MTVAENDSACPWTKLADVAAVEVAPFRGRVDATLSIPGSKSVSNRALLMAAVADGPCRLSGVLKSEDTYWTIESLRTLGVSVEIDGTDFRVTGNNFLASMAAHDIFVGSAGTAARFLPGILAARQGPTKMSGSRQMTRRPIAPLVAALQAQGARVETMGEGQRLPLAIAGGGFDGGRISLAGGESSQYLSGALIAAPLARGPVHIDVEGRIVQRDYVAITLAYLEKFGIRVDCDEAFSTFDTVPQPYRACDLALEADASTATYFFALAALTGGTVTLANLGTDTTQPDYGFVDILQCMGCAVTRSPGSTTVTGPAQLKGGFDIDMQPLSDAALTLAALAPFADAPIHIHNIAHIRKHESDRIAVACSILGQMGIKAEERPDGLSIHPGEPRFATIDPYEDHRVAMAFALTGLRGNGIAIQGPSCVSKTCPDYFDMLGSLGILVTSDPH
jgi:3-phosphoshikimate 1-carboxyvinyltransferase